VNAYNLSRTDFVRPDTVRFSMIQVPFGADAQARTRATELANRLSREIGTDPARFDEVSLRSSAPNSGFQSGDGGFLPRNMQAQQMTGANFMDTAFTLRHGQVSGVIEGVRAYQIIKITETYAQASLGLDDVLDLSNRMTVRQFIHGSLLQQRQQDAITRATAELIRELRTGNPFQIMENNLNW
jgi:parvulin-like peptidyl-prolyl isomerase